MKCRLIAARFHLIDEMMKKLFIIRKLITFRLINAAYIHIFYRLKKAIAQRSAPLFRIIADYFNYCHKHVGKHIQINTCKYFRYALCIIQVYFFDYVTW